LSSSSASLYRVITVSPFGSGIRGLDGAEAAVSDDHLGVQGAERLQAEHLVELIWD
jgi:hypothetical protein